MSRTCPECKSINISCRICDGGGIITETEMSMYLKLKRKKLIEFTNKQPLSLDLSELEQSLSLDLSELEKWGK